MQVQSADFISQSGATLTKRNAAQPGGKPRTWGMLFTVTNDANPANNITWYLNYNEASTNLFDNSNWIPASTAFGGGGSSYTFTNGLTESGGVVGLGGTATGDIEINLSSHEYILKKAAYTGAYFSNGIFFNPYVSGLFNGQLLLDENTYEWSFNGVRGNGDVMLSSSYNNGTVFIDAQKTIVLTSANDPIVMQSDTRFNNGIFQQDLSGDFLYKITSSTLTNDRSVYLPSLASDDSIVFENHAQALTNKSVNGVTLVNGGTSTLYLSQDGTYSTPSGGGGIGGSTGAVDNAMLRADGIGGTTLQASDVVVDDTANINLGVAATTGSARSVTVAGSATDIALNLVSKGNSGVIASSSYMSVIYGNKGIVFDTTTPILYASEQAAFSTPFTFSGATGNATSNTGGGVLIRGGAGYTGAGNGFGGSIFLFGGVANGTGKHGNVALNINAVANWQDMQHGTLVYNATAAPSAGIANGVAFYSKDVDSTSELFTYSESGAEVNISGLIQSVLVAGTTLTLDETHRNKIVYFTNAGAITVTVPAGLKVGYNTVLLQIGTGAIALDVTAVTLATNGKTATTGESDSISLVNYATGNNYVSK